MKFNHHELALYASTRLGKSDKEGSLWMREVDSKAAKKKQCELLIKHRALSEDCIDELPYYLYAAYVHRWFLLCGNLLFYCRTEHPVRSFYLKRII